jgi:hypothetical protein
LLTTCSNALLGIASTREFPQKNWLVGKDTYHHTFFDDGQLVFRGILLLGGFLLFSAGFFSPFDAIESKKLEIWKKAKKEG